jgi:hypothetical protein
VHAGTVGAVVGGDSSRGSVGSVVCCRQKSSAFRFMNDWGGGGLRSRKVTLPRLIEGTGLAGKWRPSGHFFPLRKSQTLSVTPSERFRSCLLLTGWIIYSASKPLRITLSAVCGDQCSVRSWSRPRSTATFSKDGSPSSPLKSSREVTSVCPPCLHSKTSDSHSHGAAPSSRLSASSHHKASSPRQDLVSRPRTARPRP